MNIQGRYPWTYLHPQEFDEQVERSKPVTESIANNENKEFKEYTKSKENYSRDTTDGQPIGDIDEANPPPKLLTTLLEPNTQSELLVFNFENIDTQRAIEAYNSCKSSVKNSSSGILEVLQDLEAEEQRENERKQEVACTGTQSQQDLSTFTRKEPESKRFAFKSLLKRTHSAPKKIQITKKQVDKLDNGEKSPQQVKCCHPIVEKLKTMADKQLHKKSAKKSKSNAIKTIALGKDEKIVLAEHTRIIRLKDSPKAERKNVAAYLEKRDSDEIVEILTLEESPSESRKRRDDLRKAEAQEAEQVAAEEPEKNFVVPENLTGTADTGKRRF